MSKPKPQSPPDPASTVDTKAEALKKKYTESPNRVMRSIGFYDARTVLARPDLTWLEFCGLKIVAYKEHWEYKKTHRESEGTSPARAITNPNKLKKAKARMEQEQKKLARLQESIRLSEEAVK